MYGIILNDHTDPYITCGTVEQLEQLVLTHWRFSPRDSQLTTVMLDPPCDWCEDEMDGWYEIDENLDFIEPPLHDHCRKAYGDQQDAMHYV